VPETIIARHAGLRVLALSMMTNMAAGMEADALSHAHTLASAAGTSEHAVKLLVAVIRAL
jgi:purine-nucleoside phosphorylase